MEYTVELCVSYIYMIYENGQIDEDECWDSIITVLDNKENFYSFLGEN